MSAIEGYTIRRFVKPVDLERHYAFRQRQLGAFRQVPKRLPKAHKPRYYAALTAFQNIVGTCMTEYVAPDTWHLSQLIVVSEVQYTGMNAAILRFVEQDAAQFNINRLTIVARELFMPVLENYGFSAQRQAFEHEGLGRFFEMEKVVNRRPKPVPAFGYSGQELQTHALRSTLDGSPFQFRESTQPLVKHLNDAQARSRLLAVEQHLADHPVFTQTQTQTHICAHDADDAFLGGISLLLTNDRTTILKGLWLNASSTQLANALIIKAKVQAVNWETSLIVGFTDDSIAAQFSQAGFEQIHPIPEALMQAGLKKMKCNVF